MRVEEIIHQMCVRTKYLEDPLSNLPVRDVMMFLGG